MIMIIGKNAAFIRVVRTRSLQDEYNIESSKVPELGESPLFRLKLHWLWTYGKIWLISWTDM